MRTALATFIMVLIGMAMTLPAQSQSELRTWSKALERKVLQQDAFEFDFKQSAPKSARNPSQKMKGTMQWWRCGRLIKKNYDAEVRLKSAQDKRVVRRRVISDGKYSWLVDEHDSVVTCTKDVAERRSALGELYGLMARYAVTRGSDDAVSGRDCEVYSGHDRHGKKNLRRRVWMDVETGLVMRREDYDEAGKPSLSFRVTEVRVLENPEPSSFRYVPARRTEVVDLTAPRPAADAQLASKKSAKKPTAKKAGAKAAKKPT